jgi:hypothetical protein
MFTFYNMNVKLKAFSYVPTAHDEVKWQENGHNISKVKLSTFYSAVIIALGRNPHTVGVKNKQGYIFHYSFNDV